MAGDWWRIDEDGRTGWVYDDLVQLVNEGSVQVVARFPLPPLLPATEAVLTFSRRMNVYSGPGGRFPVIDTTVPGYQYPITGRNVVGNWWQIDNHGQPGWVFGQFVDNSRGNAAMFSRQATPQFQTAGDRWANDLSGHASTSRNVPNSTIVVLTVLACVSLVLAGYVFNASPRPNSAAAPGTVRRYTNRLSSRKHARRSRPLH